MQKPATYSLMLLEQKNALFFILWTPYLIKKKNGEKMFYLEIASKYYTL